MKIYCLGTGDAFGTGGKFNACFYFRTASSGVLLDCGVTSLIALKKNEIASSEIDCIIISHFHGDHFGGVAFLLRETQISTTRTKPLTIIGPRGVEKRIFQSLDCLFPSKNKKLPFPLIFKEYKPGSKLQWQEINILAFSALHTEGTSPHSLKISIENKTLAYSGDTEWNENIIDLSNDADLFISEGYSYSQPRPNHMWVKDLICNKEKIGAKQIVLTHAGADVLEEQSLPFKLLADGDLLEF